MLAHVRKASILDCVQQSGSVQVADIATRLAVSEMTIRRDLMELERDGRVKRLHGGAIAFPGVEIDRDEPSFDVRMGRDRAAKERVAAAAVPLLGAARAVALDVGATTFLLAQLLRTRPELHFFTNSLRIATALADCPQPVYLPGGRVRGGEMAVGGPSAVEAFEKLWFDIAFVGVSGVTAEGFFDYSLEDSQMKAVYLRRSTRKIVLADSSKFQRMALVRVATFDEVDALVTDAPPPEPILTALKAAGVDVVLSSPAH
jgi:DeoR family glycerol-3-phosphate regulon repressor